MLCVVPMLQRSVIQKSVLRVQKCISAKMKAESLWKSLIREALLNQKALIVMFLQVR